MWLPLLSGQIGKSRHDTPVDRTSTVGRCGTWQIVVEKSSDGLGLVQAGKRYEHTAERRKQKGSHKCKSQQIPLFGKQFLECRHGVLFKSKLRQYTANDISYPATAWFPRSGPEQMSASEQFLLAGEVPVSGIDQKGEYVHELSGGDYGFLRRKRE